MLLDDRGRMPDWLERAWMTRYLDRELSETEAEWFEAYVVDKQDLVAQLEADSDLRDALAAQRGASAILAGVEAAPPVTTIVHPQRWGAALAASLIAGIGAAWVFAGMRGPSDTDTIANPTRLVFETMRGEAQPPRVDHANSVSQWVLVEASVPSGAESATLTIGNGTPISLRTSSDGFVSTLVTRDVLDRGEAASLHYTLDGADHRHELVLRYQRSEGE